MRDPRLPTSATLQTPSLEQHTEADAEGPRLLLARRLAAALGRQAAAEAWQAAASQGSDGAKAP
jgi:Tfp pilus assembly protein PilF